MNVVFNYIDPVAFNLGPLSVRWYGIIIAIGILLGYFVAQRALVKAGLHKDTLVDIIFTVLYLDLLWHEYILSFSNGHITRKILVRLLKFGMEV